ncbi:MAG: prolyl oligopeptidase family serine peptidase [Jiangellales bacterium]
MTPVLPFGSWPSIVSAHDVVGGASVPTAVHAGNGIVWWSETRPAESGREAIVRCDGDGSVHEVLPDGFSARTRVHEYGGGAWWVHDETVFATSWDDQRLYRIEPGHEPMAVTPEPPRHHSWRYADGRVTPDRRWVVCVRERHEGPDVATDVHNEIVALPADGTAEVIVLFSDTDFVAAPRISRDGRQLAWLAWNHPNMPWDATELWVGRLELSAGVAHLADPRREAGGAGESLVQPEWGRHASLFVSSDRSGWWNVHRVDGVDRLTPVVSVDAEVSLPMWVFGQARYVVRRDGTVATVHGSAGSTVLTSVPESGEPSSTELSGQVVSALADDGESLVGIVGFADQPAQVRRLGSGEVLRPASGATLPREWVSVPRQVSFPTGDGQSAHALFYPPTNPEAQTPAGRRPPVIVSVHGGPTAAARPTFSLAVQYWTSRGFAVADLDYRGSTGYGRPYRELLNGRWCEVDVEDAAALVAYLVVEDLVDGAHAAIHGGSAGGSTTFLATLLTDAFSAGVAYFGVTDLTALLAETHKFESRYFDTMIGPMPSAAATMVERSPVTHADKATVPTLVMQGLQDAVVPPAQAEAMVAALEANEVPHAYLPFEGEQHGFRIATNQVRALESELSFYGQVFGFVPAGAVAPIQLRFADRLAGRQR